MGSKAQAPAPPNYQPIAQASQAAADQQYQLGTDQLRFAQDQYAQERTDRQSLYHGLFDQANTATDLQRQQLQAGADQQSFAFNLQQQQLDSANQQATTAADIQRQQLAYAQEQGQFANQVQGRQLSQADQAFGFEQQRYGDAKAQAEANQQLTNKVTDAQLASQAQNQVNAQQDRARYQATYQPLEDKLVGDARDFSSDSRRDSEMGRAQAGVAQNFDAQRQNSTRDLESFGVNPGATRFAALDIGVRANQAAAEAAAGNQTSQYVDATGRALRSEALNIGKGYPGQIAGTYNTALAAGNGAVNNSNSTAQTASNTIGTPGQFSQVGNAATQSALQAGAYGQGLYSPALQTGAYSQQLYQPALQSGAYGLGAYAGANQAGQGAVSAYNGAGNALNQSFGGFQTANNFFQNANSAYGTGISALNTGYNNALSGAQFQNSQSSGIGTALGIGASIAGKFAGFADGGAVPTSASPSAGAQTDDIPARLNAGEFVMPKSAVEWYGQKHFHNIITKAEDERVKSQQQSGAVPAVRQAIPMAPTFRSGQGAVPMQRAA